MNDEKGKEGSRRRRGRVRQVHPLPSRESGQPARNSLQELTRIIVTHGIEIMLRELGDTPQEVAWRLRPYAADTTYDDPTDNALTRHMKQLFPEVRAGARIVEVEGVAVELPQHVQMGFRLAYFL